MNLLKIKLIDPNNFGGLYHEVIKAKVTDKEIIKIKKLNKAFVEGIVIEAEGEITSPRDHKKISKNVILIPIKKQKIDESLRLVLVMNPKTKEDNEIAEIKAKINYRIIISNPEI